MTPKYDVFLSCSHADADGMRQSSRVSAIMWESYIYTGVFCVFETKKSTLMQLRWSFSFHWVIDYATLDCNESRFSGRIFDRLFQ